MKNCMYECMFIITVAYKLFTSVAEPHHFFAPGKNFDAAPAAPTLLYSKAKFLK
jgi:hypothetical protein